MASGARALSGDRQGEESNVTRGQVGDALCLVGLVILLFLVGSRLVPILWGAP